MDETTKADTPTEKAVSQDREIRSLSVDQIEEDRDLQARVKALDGPHVENLKEAMAKGERRIGGPPVVFKVADEPANEGEKPTTRFILADGHHWLAAAIQLGKKRLEVEVRDGTRTDALRFAVGANSTHGLPRSTADKERAIQLCLKDPVLKKKSNVALSKITNTSQGLVDRVRTEWEKTHGEETERTGADGRKRKAKIKKRNASPDKQAEKDAREAAEKLAGARNDDQLARLTKPKKGMVDDIGQEVPETLSQAFAARTDIRGMLAILSNMIVKVPALREAGALAWAPKSVESNLRAVIEELNDALPSVVKDGHKHGFMSLGQYAALSAADKKALAKVAEEEVTDAEGTATTAVAA